MRASALASGLILLASPSLLAQIPIDERNVPQLERFLRKEEPLSRIPPPLQAARVKLLDQPSREGNAILQLDHGRRSSVRLGGRLDLRWGGRRVELQDRGERPDEKAADGVLSGIVDLDLEALKELLERTRNLKPEALRRRTLFDGRVGREIGRRELAPIPALDLRPGVEIELGFLRDRLRLLEPRIAVKSEHSLMITHLSVVEDEVRTFDPCTRRGTRMGPWTFGHLMTEMANEPATGITPSEFTRRWLARWQRDQIVNDQVSRARPTISSAIIAPWEAASGGPGAPLDLSIAPFRLLAIVNRIDLRDNFGYGGGGGSAGEARFVFGALDLQGCQPLPFTVIFEYGIRKESCEELHAWAESWAQLSTMPLPSAELNAALQVITDSFVRAGANPTQSPNGSALSQLRTNEIALGFPWELREFRLDGTSTPGHLEQVTVKQNPAQRLNGSTALATWANANVPLLLADQHVIPVMFPGVEPFLGAFAEIDPPRFFWDGSDSAPIPNREARFHLSLNTCNGCHGGETFPATAPFFFTHVQQRAANVEARLSGFLTGVDVRDPADGAPIRHFADLERRRIDLETLLSTSCRHFPITELFFVPVRMVH